MVLILTEMEINWRLKWLFRPRQGTGMKVEDYYAQFRDWKEEIVSLSFPADEGDYIDGFLENLSCGIRLRLSKQSWGRNRLINAFYDAKTEESMMFIEEAFKKIKAHILFDKMPSRVSSDKSQMTVSVETDSNKNVEQNEACYVLAEMPEPFREDEAYSSALEALIWMFEEDEQSPPLKPEGVVDAHQLFDESPVNISAGKKEGNGLKPRGISDVHLSKILSYGFDERIDPIFLSKVDEQFVDRLGQPFSLKMTDSRTGHHLFEEMSRRISAGLNIEVYTIQDYIAHFCYVLQIFYHESCSLIDDGNVFSFDTGISYWFLKGCGFTVKHNFDKMPSNLNVELWVGKLLMFVFDPGLCVIFILEDKDVFEGVVKRIISMDTLVIWDYELFYKKDVDGSSCVKPITACCGLMFDFTWSDCDDYIGWKRFVRVPGLYIILEEFKDSLYYVFNICYDAEQYGICNIIFLLSNSTIWPKPVCSLWKCKIVLSLTYNDVFSIDPGGSPCLLRTGNWSDIFYSNQGGLIEYMAITLFGLSLSYWFSRRVHPPSGKVCVCAVFCGFHVACGLVMQFRSEVLLVFFPFQTFVLNDKYMCHWLYFLSNVSLDDKRWEIGIQEPDHCISLKPVKWINMALDFDVVGLFRMRV